MSDTAKLINDKYKRFYTSQHYEEWDPRFFEKYDISEFIQNWDRLDPDVVIATARTHNGAWFCDIGLGPVHRGLKGVDQLDALIKHFRPKGKPIIAYISTIFDKKLFEQHPEWRPVDADGNSVKGDRSWGKVVCPNSPYKEYLIEMIKRLIDTHDIDGIYFDMVAFPTNRCYCESCSRLFRSLHNAEIPKKEDWDDPLFRKFIQFRQDSNYLFVREICDTVKKADPRLSTLIQYLVLHTGSISGQSLALGSVPDYLYNDVYSNQGYLQMSVRTKLLSSISRYRPEIGIMTRPGSHNDAPNMKTLDHLRSEAFTVIANGAAIMLFDIMWDDGTIHDAMWDRIKQVFDEVEEREPWLGGDPVKSVAIFYSENTRIWYGRSDRTNKYDANFFGACRALIEEHVLFNIVTALDEKSLSDYQVLVLPNTVCMSGQEVDAVRDFVQKGGGLVCTGKASLWDENGDACRDFQLSDVLGVSYVGDTAAYSRVYSKFEVDNHIAGRLPADGFITSWGSLSKVKLGSATSIAKIVFPYTEPTGTRFVNIMANPPAVPSDWPACTCNEFGSGKAVFFLGGIDKDYLSLSFPELKWLIVDAVRAASRESLKVGLRGPMSVEMIAFERNNGSQLVIHLVNFQVEIGRNAILGTTRSRQQIQEILPVFDLELTVRVKKQIQKVTIQPEGIALPYEQNDGCVKVTIPRLDCHSMVVIEL